MTGRLVDLSCSMSGKQRITVEIDGDFRDDFDRLHEKPVSVEIKAYRRKRSLDANAYAWVLMEKIAIASSQPHARVYKDDVYRQAIRSISGVSETVSIPTEAVEQLCRGWCSHGRGWQVEQFPSKTAGCTSVTFYLGSSEYDTAQMSALIDYLIDEAKGLGIETATPDEIAKYKDLWDKE